MTLESEHQKNINWGFTFRTEGKGQFPFMQQAISKGHYDISDLGPQAWRKAYVAALFAEDRRWLAAIEKYQMLVPGSPKNSRDKARDLAVKERLAEQVSIYTYEDRKAFFEAWRKAPCCADSCERYCDECSNKEIQFNSISTFRLDADIRKYITRYGRYQTKSELESEASNVRKKSTGAFLSGVRDRRSDNETIRIQGEKRDGLPCEPEEVTSDQAERVEAMLLYSGGQELVT